MTSVSVAVKMRSRVGEGPIWYDDALQWVDILAGRIHRSDLASGSTSTIEVPTWVGAAVPMAGGGYVAATREGFATVVDGHLDTFSAHLPDGIRMNDAKCDPAGRLWAGSCAEDFTRGAGGLECLDVNWGHRTVITGLTQPNGIGWSPDAATMYLIDSQDAALYAYEFDLERGAVGERRTVVTFDVESAGYPDGLAVDAEGFVWIALWGGSAVVRVSPDGVIVRRIALPVSQPTSCAFIGPELDALCVTSAAEGLVIDAASIDGSVFVLRDLGVVGLPVATFGG